MDGLISWLSTPEAAALLWGLYPRLLGLVWAVCLLAFVPQLLPLAGSRGITPVKPVLAAARRDFGARAYYWWPTLFWLCSDDWALVVLPLVGGLAALYAFLVGGAWTPAALRLAWAVLLSIDAGPNSLVYPWDSLLLEVGFMAPFLPVPPALPWGAWLGQASAGQVPSWDWAALAASELPVPIMQWAHRFVLFRLLIGFGKLKFGGSGWSDRLYIKSFTLTQPMLSPLGLWAYRHLPDLVWVGLLVGMFVVELVLPWGLLFSNGAFRVLAALGIIGLMAGIQASGNFGYFNMLTAVVALPCLSLGPGSAFTWTIADDFPASAFTAGAPGAALLAAGNMEQALAAFGQLVLAYPVHAVFLALTLTVLVPGGVFQLLMNSWINLSWPYWPGVARLRVPNNALVDAVFVAPARAYAAFLRCILQFRVVQAYGVFPPQTSPPQRWACVYEASSDGGKTWHRLEYKYYLSNPHTPPRFIAPFHPRLDHAVFYESLGMNGNNMMCSLGNLMSPYAFPSHTTAWSRLQARLVQAMEGKEEQKGNGLLNAILRPFGLDHLVSSSPVLYFFRGAQGAGHLPTAAPGQGQVRMLACHFTPVETPTVDHSTGRVTYWNETVMSMHMPPLSAGDLPKVEGHAEPFPLCATIPAGPHHMWPESMHWIRRAVLAGNATDADDNRIGRLVLFLRELKGTVVAGARQDRSSSSSAAAPPGNVEPTQPATSVRRRRAGSTASVKGSVSGPAPVPAVESALLCSDDAAKDAFVLVPPALVHAKAEHPMDVTPVLAQEMTWANLPATVSALRAKYSGPALVQISEDLGHATLPLLAACDVAFGGLPPSWEAFQSAMPAFGPRTPEATWRQLYDEWLAMVEGPGADTPQLNATKYGLPTQTTDGRAVHYFAGNDDMNMFGCMRNPLRWLMWAHLHVLSREYDGFKRTQAALPFMVGQETWDPKTWYTRLYAMDPVHVYVWLRLTLMKDLCPSHVPTEAGTFLLFLLHYDTVVAHATTSHRLMAQSTPVRTRQTPGDVPHFLPAFLPLISRLVAHEDLRKPLPLPRGHAGTSTGKASTTATGQADVPDVPRVPKWAWNEPAGAWRLMGV